MKRFSLRIYNQLAQSIINNKKKYLFFLLVMTLFFGFGLTKLGIDNSNERMFVKGDKTIEMYNNFQDEFGSDKFIFFLLNSKQSYAREDLEKLKLLEKEISSIKYKDEEVFEEVIHIANAKYISGDGGAIEVSPMFKGLENGDLSLDQFIERVKTQKSYHGTLISKNGKNYGVFSRVLIIQGDHSYHGFINKKINEIKNKEPFKNWNLVVAGGPILDAQMDEFTMKESALFGLLSLSLNFLVILYLFRRKMGVLLPMATVILTLIWTFGLMGYLGINLNIIHVILPMMLIAVGIGDSIHFINEYQNQYRKKASRRNAVIKTIEIEGLACLLTSLTTAAGMSSLLLAKIDPIQSLGLFAAIGVIFAYIISLFMIPATLHIFGVKSLPRKDKLKSKDNSQKFLIGISNFSFKYKVPISITAVALFIFSVVGTLKINVESNFVHSFDKDYPLRASFEKIDNTLGGSSSIQMIIDTNKADGIKEPEFLRKLDKLQNWIESEYAGNVFKTISIREIVKSLNKTIMDGDDAEYKIPDSKEAVAQELMLYESGDPDGLWNIITEDYQKARLDIRTQSSGTRSATIFMAEVKEKAQEIFGSETKIYFTGISQMFVAMAENISKGQIVSFLLAFVLIALMMVVVLKSFYLGILSMIPNLLPVFLTLACMGFLGVNLDFVTLLIGCVAIGIAVDDTIHFLLRFKEEFEMTKNYKKAIEATLVTTGRALLFTTIILVSGFLMFGFSDMVSISRFGILVALTLTIALVADFIFVPALLFLLKPLGKEKLKKCYSKPMISLMDSNKVADPTYINKYFKGA